MVPSLLGNIIAYATYFLWSLENLLQNVKIY